MVEGTPDASDQEPDADAAMRRAVAVGELLEAQVVAAHRDAERASAAVDELARKAAVWQILTAHFAAGTRSWSEVFDRLSEDEWAELARLVGDRDLAELLQPDVPPGVEPQPGRRRRRWAGTAHKPLPVVVIERDSGAPEQPDDPRQASGGHGT